MPKLLMPRDLTQRMTIPLLVALAVLFLLGPPPKAAFAKEVTKTKEISEQTTLQASRSAEHVSARSAGSGDVKIGKGEAVAGDAYAGGGCARAGDVTAGDCGERGSGGSREGNSGNGDPGGGASGETPPPREDDGMTAPESTSEQTTSEATVPDGASADETTSSAGPATDDTGLCPARQPKNAARAAIEDATDGDTVELAKPVRGYDTIRLIGVDTPEIGEASEDGRPEPLAEEARDFTAGELEGREVLLQVGEEETDRYGRLLAYVWTGAANDGGFIGGLKRMLGMGEAELFNLTLLEGGYAEVLTVEPNDLYAECFETAEREARDDGIGIWAEDEYARGPGEDQYDEETTPQPTAQTSPTPEPETEPVENAPVEQSPAQTAPTEEAPDEASPNPEDDSAAEEPARQPSLAEGQYEPSPPPEARQPEPEVQDEEVQEPEIQDEEIQEPEVQEPEVQESVAPSGGDDAAVLETAAWPEASVEAGASPEPTGRLPVGTASTAPVSALPETSGPFLLTLRAGLAAVFLLTRTALGFPAVRSLLGRDVPGRR